MEQPCQLRASVGQPEGVGSHWRNPRALLCVPGGLPPPNRKQESPPQKQWIPLVPKAQPGATGPLRGSLTKCRATHRTTAPRLPPRASHNPLCPFPYRMHPEPYAPPTHATIPPIAPPVCDPPTASTPHFPSPAAPVPHAYPHHLSVPS